MSSQHFIKSKSPRFGIGPILASLLAAAAAFAADDDQDEQPAAQVEPRVLPAIRLANGAVQIDPYDPNGQLFRHKVSAKLRYLKHVCQLNESQEKKLALAAEGDDLRYREVCQALAVQLVELQKKGERAKVVELVQEMNALAQQRADPFNADSLFHRTLNRILDREQLERLNRQPPPDAYQSLIGENLPLLARRIRLRPEQYPALAELVTFETDPPKKYGRFEYMYLVYRVSQIPADRFESLLDDAQRARLAEQYVAGAESFLVEKGILDQPLRTDDPADLLPAADLLPEKVPSGAERATQTGTKSQAQP